MDDVKLRPVRHNATAIGRRDMQRTIQLWPDVVQIVAKRGLLCCPGIVLRHLRQYRFLGKRSGR